jgi:acyl-CoA reductase-like NAD-dependent aldehyde dehydrogenase
LLELGGKALAIVWEDADLKLAAHECALGAFLHSGQICTSTEKIIVHKNIVQKFEEEMTIAVKQLFTEPAVLINKAGVEKNRRLVKDAVSKGANLLYGDVDARESTETRMSPIIVKGVTKDMDLYTIESFGPSVSMTVVETEEEALKIANDTEYGLHAAIFTEDLRRALKMAKFIEAGAVHINAMTVHDEPALLHGGVKNSGYERFGSPGLEEWVKTKTVTFKN